jgi:hypothetical protein
VNGFEKKIPALFTKALIDPNSRLAVSINLVAVAGSAIFPSTSASLSDQC